jgi:hypothetical protein
MPAARSGIDPTSSRFAGSSIGYGLLRRFVFRRPEQIEDGWIEIVDGVTTHVFGSGVTEYVVGVLDINDKPVFGPIGARVASGTGSDLSISELQEAIDLHHWASSNPDVFSEGRVAYPS